MDPGKIFQIITNSTLLATRLFSGGREAIHFSEPRYCSVLPEDTPTSASVVRVSATHKGGGATIRYSITGGNKDGLFTIDQHSGLITLSATLDYELQRKHELVVAAEAEGSSVHSFVAVSVADVNDNPPQFLQNDAKVTVLEGEDEDLPKTIFKVVAQDADSVDTGRLIYSVGGEGVSTDPSDTDPFFTINPHSGEVLQLKALDRDPPKGKASWQLRVQVRDGQRVPSSLAEATKRLPRKIKKKQQQQKQQKQQQQQQQQQMLKDVHHPPLAGDRPSSQIQGNDPHTEISSQSLPPPLAPLSSQPPLSVGPSRLIITADGLSEGGSSSYLYRERRVDGVGSSLGNSVAPFSSSASTSAFLVSLSRSNMRTSQRRENISKVKDEGDNYSTFAPYASSSTNILTSHQRNHLISSENSEKKTNFRLNDMKDNRQKSFYAHINQARSSTSTRLSDRLKQRRNRVLRRTVITAENEKETAAAAAPAHTADISSFQNTTPKGHVIGRSTESTSNSFTQGNLSLIQSQDIWIKPQEEHRQNTSSSSTSTLTDIKIPPISPISSGEKENTMQREIRQMLIKRGYISMEGITSQFKRSVPLGVPKEETQRTPLNVDSSTTGLPKEPAIIGKRKDLKEEDPKDGSQDGYHLFTGNRFSTFSTDGVGGCEDYTSFSFNFDVDDIAKVGGKDSDEEEEDLDLDGDLGSHMLGEDDDSGLVHVVETVITVVVKDLNDNPPLFPNVTIRGEVQENGPIDLSVAVVTAWDADDVEEGTNARLTYSIGKNVLEERSGQAIFAIHPDTGLLTTAVCCLDRETTPEYHIQVVAVDGGGLTGTGQVAVRLADVNDNSPRLSRDLWEVAVEESWSGTAPSNKTLTQFTTVDHDISNYFFYRVVEESGWGWQYFDVRSRGHIGELYSIHPLDYEDSAHRRGFRFMIQVTDRGRGGWDDPRHTDTAWVSVQLLDINDNPPQFSQPQIHLTLQENVTPGTVLTNLIAQDHDMGGMQDVKYSVVGGWGALTVNADGVVRLWRALDREMAGGDVGVAKVIAIDDGDPPLTSTATLTITVTDVNDCPPRLLPPTLLHVIEGRPATRLGLLRATDDDVWALGHGPPFFFSLPPSNPPYLFQLLALKYNSSEDSGRGGAEIWTRGAVDREQYPQLTVEIEVSDAGGLSTTQPVTIIIDDINDNPMKSASKIVYLWKTQGGGSEASLGRVYVEDPDDWDLEDKTFSWLGSPHALFSLDQDTGAIFASAHVREGRYDLQFSVSDPTWGQTDVRANVTVDVRYLHPDAITHALPLTLTPITPTALTTGWSPKRGGGGLGTLAKAVKEIVGSSSATVEIVSVYGHPKSDAIYSSTLPKATPLVHSPVSSFTCVWLSVKQSDGNYVNPVKLQGLLSLHNRELEKMMSVGVSLREPASEAGFGASLITPSSVSSPQQPSSLASLASTALPLQVVDTNTTSLVTPRLSRSHACPSHFEEDSSDSCTRTSCLNGGRCVRNSDGNSRCICPGGSWGLRCKIVARTFKGNGWTWIRPFPPCLPTTLSIKVLTRRPNALLMYSGPLSFSSTHPRYPTTPMMTLQLVEGRPQLLMESARGSIKLQVDSIFEMGIWHTLHLHVDAQGVTLMADLCEFGWVEGAKDDNHCIARASWDNPNTTDDWVGGDPVQLGGLSHSRPSPQQYGWTWSPSDHALEGCISHVTVNGQLIDLGEPAYSSSSWPGCRPQESACMGKCGLNGRCTGGIASPWCDCDPGWAPPICDKPTVPASFSSSSYLKMAISFTPDPYSITSQLRVRALGRPDGLLMKLENHHRSAALIIRLRGGVVCASVTSNDFHSPPESCIDGYPLGDGSWHTVYAGRHGPNLLLSVDDGDGWRHNHTLASFLKARSPDLSSSSQLTSISQSSSSSSSSASSSSSFEKPVPLIIDKQNGVSVGGVPEYEHTKLLNVRHDISDICIDDIRVSGKGLPLPPAVNATTWGQVTTFRNLENDCPSGDLCSNSSCLPPLSCHNSWRQASCSCGPGRQLLGGSCQMVNECVYHPCLHGGTCHNIHPGYRCSCQLYHSGDNCQWVHLPAHTHPVTPMVIAAITLSILVFVVIGVVVTLRLHKSLTGRSGELRPTCVEGASEVGDIAGVIETPISAHSYKRNEEPVLLDALKLKVQAEQHSLEGKKSPSLSCKGSGLKEGGYHHSSSLRRSTVGHDNAKDIITSSLKLPPRVTLCSKEDTCKLKSPAESPSGGGSTDDERPRVAVVCGQFSTYPPPAKDDLRAYAYEGEGSPTGSLTSATIGLHMELREEDVIIPLLPEYGEVFNLLTKLPDAPYTKILSETPPSYPSGQEKGSSSPIKTLSAMVSSPEKTIQDKQSQMTSLETASGPSDVRGKQTSVVSVETARGQSDTKNKQECHVRRKSSLIGMSTAC